MNKHMYTLTLTNRIQLCMLERKCILTMFQQPYLCFLLILSTQIFLPCQNQIFLDSSPYQAKCCLLLNPGELLLALNICEDK